MTTFLYSAVLGGDSFSMKTKYMHPSHSRGNAWGQLDSEVKRVQDPACVLGSGEAPFSLH